MNNPFKQIENLELDRNRHHERLIQCELFQNAANRRLQHLEEEGVTRNAFNRIVDELARKHNALEKEQTDRNTVTAVALKGLIKRVTALEEAAKPPVGLDEPIIYATNRDRILAALRQFAEPKTPGEIARISGLSSATVRAELRRMDESGLVVRTGYGLYRPAPTTARAVGQRNGA